MVGGDNIVDNVVAEAEDVSQHKIFTRNSNKVHSSIKVYNNVTVVDPVRDIDINNYASPRDTSWLIKLGEFLSASQLSVSQPLRDLPQERANGYRYAMRRPFTRIPNHDPELNGLYDYEPVPISE